MTLLGSKAIAGCYHRYRTHQQLLDKQPFGHCFTRHYHRIVSIVLLLQTDAAAAATTAAAAASSSVLTTAEASVQSMRAALHQQPGAGSELFCGRPGRHRSRSRRTGAAAHAGRRIRYSRCTEVSISFPKSYNKLKASCFVSSYHVKCPTCLWTQQYDRPGRRSHNPQANLKRRSTAVCSQKQ